MITKFNNQLGFTLIEMLIVIIILGILAMIIVPQITVSTEDAKISTLQTNLSGIRSSVETYYAQHSNIYPGRMNNTGSAYSASGNEAATAFEEQLTQYTTASGHVANAKDTSHKYGPYIKGGKLPDNPFTSDNDVVVDYTVVSILERTADGGAGKNWKFYAKTGVFIANDTTTHAKY